MSWHSESIDKLTSLQDHPGGAKIILKYAGRDATAAYEPIHPPDALDKNLPREKHLGDLDSSSIAALSDARQHRKKTEDELRIEREQANKPPISRILTLQEMEVRPPPIASSQVPRRLNGPYVNVHRTSHIKLSPVRPGHTIPQRLTTKSVKSSGLSRRPETHPIHSA